MVKEEDDKVISKNTHHIKAIWQITEQLRDADGRLGALHYVLGKLEAALPEHEGPVHVTIDGLAARVHVSQLVCGLERGGECGGERVALVRLLEVRLARAAVLVDVA